MQDVNTLINDSQKRFNDYLHQIAWYRMSLAQDLQNEAATIIEEECKEIDTVADAVPLVPNDEQDS